MEETRRWRLFHLGLFAQLFLVFGEVLTLQLLHDLRLDRFKLGQLGRRGFAHVIQVNDVVAELGLYFCRALAFFDRCYTGMRTT